MRWRGSGPERLKAAPPVRKSGVRARALSGKLQTSRRHLEALVTPMGGDAELSQVTTSLQTSGDPEQAEGPRCYFQTTKNWVPSRFAILLPPPVGFPATSKHGEPHAEVGVSSLD